VIVNQGSGVAMPTPLLVVSGLLLHQGPYRNDHKCFAEEAVFHMSESI
jgi:hypothetical protein